MTSSKTLQQAIADITIWRKGEQRAPHKPLLLLHVLAGYQQGHGRLFDYGSEVRDPLHSLLERFGPQRAQYRPDMPFWRLQGDGFWELQNAEQCSTSGSSKQPPAGELVTHNVAGGFDEQHFTLLKKNKNPTAEDIKRELAGNMCRCAAYNQIIGAVPAPPASITLAWARFWRLALIPMAARSCWMAWAIRGFGSVFMT